MLKEVKIELTNKCSRNCKHCSSNATSSIGNLKILDFEDVSRIIKEAKLMGADTIVFTGGEPLMYDRLPELVELTSKLGMKSTIYTFAYRTDETLNKYKQLIDLGLNKIVYSLADSLSDEEDISVYDKAEFFNKVFENNNARLGFHYTVSKDSFSRLESVVTKTIETFKSRSYFDRVSQYLLKNVIYNGKKYSNEDMLFRILLFKLFNKESTWELLLNNFEDITLKTFNIKKYSSALENAISSGIKIYNDAYISCANKAFGYDRKHDNHLALLNKMFNEDKIQERLVKCKTMEEAFNIIKSYPLIGNFMAYQLVTDINYSEVVNWKEDEFTVAGPGSLRGIKKCFIDKGKMSNEDIIRYMYKHQEEEFKRLGLEFKRIGNRPLQLIDCQNIFCELDKYCRQALPDLKSNRTKIKKHYVPKKEIIEYIYPPKWKLNN